MDGLLTNVPKYNMRSYNSISFVYSEWSDERIDFTMTWFIPPLSSPFEAVKLLGFST